MTRVPSTLAAVAGLLTLCACSGPDSTDASSTAVPPSAAAATSVPARAPASSPPGPATAPATAGDVARVAPRPSADSAQQQITALSTAGGVPSTVLRLTADGQAPTVRTTELATGQTLRVIVVSPVATHLTGQGIGVDLEVPAGSPTAVDVVAFAPGNYVLTTRGGTVVLKAKVHG